MLSQFKFFNQILVCFFIIIQISQSTQDIQLANSTLSNFSSTIQSIQYSQDNEFIYLSQLGMDGLYSIKKYNLTQFMSPSLNLQTNSSQPIPQTIFYPSTQTHPMTQIMQINSTYLITYSTHSRSIDIFYLNGTVIQILSKLNQISNILYSETLQELFLIYQNGEIQITYLDTFLGFVKNQTSVFIQDYVTSSIIAILSPDQTMLAVQCIQKSQISLLNVSSYQTIMNITFQQQSLTQQITWSSNSQSVFVYNYLNDSIVEISAIFPYLQTYHPLNTNNTVTIYELIYSNLTGELVIIGRFNQTDQIYFLNYNLQLNHLTVIRTIKINLTSEIFVKQKNGSVTVLAQGADGGVQAYFGKMSSSSGGGGGGGGGSVPVTPNIITEQRTREQILCQNTIDSTLSFNLLSILNKVPGSRITLKPIFLYFANFDDIWPYIYHERQYSQVVNILFTAIKNLQNQKWQTVNYQILWTSITGYKMQHISSYLNSTSKSIFTSYKYYQTQNQANGYILNTLNFYASNLLFIIIVYLFFKFLYYIFNYTKLVFKQFFSTYRFGYFLIILSLEGNIQIMMYLFGFQMKSLVKKNYNQNAMLWLVVGINFIFVFVVIALHLFIQASYRKQALSIYDNFSNTRLTCFYMTSQASLRNIVLGLSHIMISQKIYGFKILILLIEQVIFFSINIYFVNKETFFIKKTRVWINMVANLLRILFVASFLLKFQSQGEKQLTQNIQVGIIILYVVFWFISMTGQFVLLFLQGKQFFAKNVPKRFKDTRTCQELQLPQNCLNNLPQRLTQNKKHTVNLRTRPTILIKQTSKVQRKKQYTKFLIQQSNIIKQIQKENQLQSIIIQSPEKSKNDQFRTIPFTLTQFPSNCQTVNKLHNNTEQCQDYITNDLREQKPKHKTNYIDSKFPQKNNQKRNKFLRIRFNRLKVKSTSKLQLQKKT